jgi:hypothetical protein
MGDFLKKILPYIGAAATGNVPALIGLAAQQVGSALGTKINPDLNAITAAVAGATPEQLAKLKEQDQQFQLQVQAMGFKNAEELEKIAAEDRSSARAREMAIKDKVPAWLALGVTGGFFALLFLMVFKPLPVANSDLLNVMLGALGTAWVSIIAYYFGSSSGSAAKTELMGKFRQQMAAPGGEDRKS